MDLSISEAPEEDGREGIWITTANAELWCEFLSAGFVPWMGFFHL